MISRRLALTPRLALALVLLVGLALRADGVNWDSSQHLHPDERYLSLVAGSVRLPSSMREYLSVRSPLNPYRTESGSALVYGTFPLNATKAVAGAVGRDRFDGLEIVGRRLSSLADLATILVVFGLGRLLALGAGSGRTRAAWAGVAGAATYALAPLAIQHAHFFVVDSWLTAAFGGSLLAAAHAQRAATSSRRTALVGLAGALLGVALACKLSAALFAPAVVLLAIAAVRGRGWALVLGAASNLLLLAASAYLALRLAAPATFASDDWSSFALAPDLARALEVQASAVAGGDGPINPPSTQWLVSTPVLSPLLTLGAISLGPPIALAAAAGIGLAGLRAFRAAGRREVAWLELALLGCTVIAGAYLVSRFVHTVRYLLPLVPLLCALAGVALARLAAARHGKAIVAAAGVLATGWAFAYTAIYRAPHTRLVASEWIRDHTAPGYVVVGEEWDDPLPVPSEPELRVRQLPVYAPDGEAKLRELWDELSVADLVVLSSARASATVGRLPGRYPIATRYYRELLAGRLGFTPAARFRSRPRLAGIEVPDEWAEEVTWVYDHPEVRILRRSGDLTYPEFRRRVLRSNGSVH